MAQSCTRCQGSGFLNIEQLPLCFDVDNQDGVLKWIEANEDHDVSVCDCCGDSEEWYGSPGQHYHQEDPIGHQGPYGYNGGLSECH